MHSQNDIGGTWVGSVKCFLFLERICFYASFQHQTHLLYCTVSFSFHFVVCFWMCYFCLWIFLPPCLPAVFRMFNVSVIQVGSDWYGFVSRNRRTLCFPTAAPGVTEIDTSFNTWRKYVIGRDIFYSPELYITGDLVRELWSVSLCG